MLLLMLCIFINGLYYHAHASAFERIGIQSSFQAAWKPKEAPYMMNNHQFNQLADKAQTKHQPQTLAQWYVQAAPEVADVDLPIEPRNATARDDVDWGKE